MTFSRSRRRLYVTFYALALLLLYPYLHERLGLLAVVLFLLVSPILWSGRIIVAALTDKPLDEREQRVSTAGFTTAYSILVATLLVSLWVSDYNQQLPESFASLNRYFLLNREVLFEFWTLLLIAHVLPACVVAWTEPDLLPAEVQPVPGGLP